MHMCIWAVTSILKIFESRPELFLAIHGPPPPASDSDSYDCGEDDSAAVGLAGADLDMRSESNADANQNLPQAPDSQ